MGKSKLRNERKNPFDRAITQVIQALGEPEARSVVRVLVRDLDRQIPAFPSSLLEREFTGADIDAFAKAEGFQTRRNGAGPEQLLSRVRDAVNVPSLARMLAMAQEWDPSGDARVAVIAALQPAFSHWWESTTNGIELASLLSTLDPVALGERAASKAFVYALAGDLAAAGWAWLADGQRIGRALCWSMDEPYFADEIDGAKLTAEARREIAGIEIEGDLALLDEWDALEQLRANTRDGRYDSNTGRAFAALFREAAECVAESSEDPANVRASLVRLSEARAGLDEPYLTFTIQTRKAIAASRERSRLLPDVVTWVRERYRCPELRRLLELA